MNFQIPEWVKPAVWGAVVGAVAIAIVGFAAGWVVTSGAAEQMVSKEKKQAVIAALTPVCVAQFKSLTQQQQQVQLAALKGESSWKRGDFVEEQGWATMPGTTEPNGEVADACASELMKVAGN
ncbi:MAG TPA: hypothetical protein VF226_16845 [Hyphomicrobiaceae bacterium]|jgi:hypothetical protein